MKIFVLSLLLALVSSQSEWEQLITLPATVTTVTAQTTETPTISVNKHGRSCHCVPYYQCDSEEVEDQLSTASHTSLLDDREEKPCIHYSEVCCVNPTKTKPQPDPTKVKGCGYRNPEGFGRKFEGSETKFGEFPWVVALLDATNSSYVGAGVIISPEVVMTVAHIAKKYTPGTLKIRAGEWDSQTLNEIYDYQERGVKEIYIHDEYFFNRTTLLYDIALLRLDQPLVLAEHINVICLPEENENFDSYKTCVVNGWGKDTFGKEGRYSVMLQKADLDMVPNNRCDALLKRTRLGTKFVLHDSFVCAIEQDVERCKTMVSGGPLVCPTGDNRYKLAGLAAWGVGCGWNNHEVPAVYTNVAKFRAFVDDKLKSWSTVKNS